MGEIVVGRRGFLVGASGMVLLSGCGGSGGATGTTEAASTSPSPSSTGPVINSKDPGNVVTGEDLQALVRTLDEAFERGDLDELVQVLKVESYQVDDLRQRLRAARTVPLENNHFYVSAPTDRMVNSSGGPVPFDSDLVLTHQIADCDAHPVAQSYRVELVKPASDAPVEVVRWGGRADDGTSPLPWELAEISSVRGEHATILTRSRDLAGVRRFLPLADAGAADAMAAIAPPRGVSKVAFTLAWDRESDEDVFGRWEKTIDRAAVCAYVSFVDPQELADGTAKPREQFSPGDSASGRVLMRRASRTSESYFRTVACHESVHALAGQWGRADSWVAEGLAEWVSAGYSAGVRAQAYGDVRAGFRAFASGVVQDDFDFQAEATAYRNYQCSAAVFSWAEATRGRATALRLARECYLGEEAEAVRKVTGRSFPAVLEEVAAWLPRW